MKRIKILLLALCLFPCVARAASNDFMVAAQLLSAAKNADIQQVQILINNGADVNFVDSTGLSLVCTALMNNDVRAAQILQMYGADASKCDRQIKQYNSRKKAPNSGGLFSGLSSAHGITLAAAGAAVVVGGLLLLTDVFDPDGGGSNSSSNSGDRPGGGGDNGSGGNTGTSTKAFTLPYGPAMPDAVDESEKYVTLLNAFATDADWAVNYEAMTDEYGQNYLLMMRGYSPMARGYLGMRTLRNKSNVPLNLAGNNVGVWLPEGGIPVNVAMVTANGVNATENSSLADKFMLWTTSNNGFSSANPGSNDMMSSKYYNNTIIRGDDNQSLTDDVAVEDSAFVGAFDLSGFGTAINNASATGNDNLIAKIVGGNLTSVNLDFVGFMPNGQMSIFRTGAGAGMVDLGATDTPVVGGYTMAGDALATNDTIVLNEKTLTITRTGNAIVAKDDADTEYTGYIGADGLLYINSGADEQYQAFKFDAENKLTQMKKYDDTIDYLNYTALRSAAGLKTLNASGRAEASVIANASVIEPLRAASAATMDTVLASTQATMKANFAGLVDQYYNLDTTDTNLPSVDAASFFNGLGSRYSPLVVFSTGSYDTGYASYAGASQFASFENSAPLVFDNLEHLFMSVVAVRLNGNGTVGTNSIDNFNPSGTYELSTWNVGDNYYKSRICGIAGTGANGIDPWCFAAAGTTDENAVASAAGAAGALVSAFGDMFINDKQTFDSKKLFTLLALTADGAYLGSDSMGNSLTEDALIAHLQSMYTLPDDYQFKYASGAMDYLTAFKEVFGYGLINLERATMPNKSIYYYNGTDIVSASGNAYWRAAQNTTFKSSSAFSPRVATLSAPFFDVLTSADGELSMPRVWQNEFNLGTSSRRALYMGDTLGELHTRDDAPATTTIGNMTMTLSASPREYVDEFGGLDNLNIRFALGNWELNAGYQHYVTDGASRFSGLSNPIFGLATNAVTTGAKYNFGNWAFGVRAMSGLVTDEGLLENDPTITSQYAPAHLGQMMGMEATTQWTKNGFSFNVGLGAASETNTLLGAHTDGLLSLGAGDTTYVTGALGYDVNKDIRFQMRGTVARTTSDADGEFIMGLSDIWSDSVAIGANIGNFNFSISRPLAVSRGAMRYAYADYDVIEVAGGKYELNVVDTHVANIDLSPENRELRFMGTYKHKIGEFTDGALGMIYRVNPNNTREFGNESIFMMKLTHRVGI